MNLSINLQIEIRSKAESITTGAIIKAGDTKDRNIIMVNENTNDITMELHSWYIENTHKP